MTRYVLSPRAREDLSEIWDYTAEHWGSEQADRYVRQISAACEDLANGRKQGRSAEVVSAGYFRYNIESHVLFYRIQADGETAVVRILHKSMDVAKHL